MTDDEWAVVRTEHLSSGNVRVAGVHATQGPFTITVTLEQYETRGSYEAVRTFFEHHPTALEARA